MNCRLCQCLAFLICILGGVACGTVAGLFVVAEGPYSVSIYWAAVGVSSLIGFSGFAAVLFHEHETKAEALDRQLVKIRKMDPVADLALRLIMSGLTHEQIQKLLAGRNDRLTAEVWKKYVQIVCAAVVLWNRYGEEWRYR